MLTDGSGGDFLIGRGGADRFDYNDTIDSRPDAPDLIQDFGRAQGDKIDLAGIDARAHVVGNQTFNFIGQAQFTAEG
ncbi:MAG: M10 family metallopeptidase C-terminal domain-containing protein [Geminicoccaceae bacterium]